MTDLSDTSLAGALGRVGRDLDAFLTFEHGDPVSRRAAWTAALDRPLPEVGVGADAVLAELGDVVVPNGSRIAEPGCWGWIVSVPGAAALATQAAASVASSQRYLIQSFNLLEEVALRWLAELCGLDPDRMRGVFSSGGSVANLVALGAARQWAFEQHGVDPAAEGVPPGPTAIYASEQTHHTVQRAAAVLGLGRSSLRSVPCDDRQRMRPDALAEQLAADRRAGVLPVAVVANAGTTNTGAIDPIRAVGELAAEHNAWFHVDGAYGLLGGLDERLAALYDGLDLADSAIIDPHKWLGAPTGIAATLVRDRSILFRAFTQEPADYLEPVSAGDGSTVLSSFENPGIPYYDFGVELSAPARGAVVWSILRELGRSGVAARVRSDNDLARQVAALAHAHPRLEVVAEPTLSICCFRYRPAEGSSQSIDLDALNAAVHLRLLRETPWAPSTTRVDGALVLRPCFVNVRTRPDHVDAFVDDVVRLGDELAVTSPGG